MVEEVGKKLNTRIKLKYASYDDWQSSSLVLYKGEVAVCYINDNNAEIKNTAPTVLFKVGDGEHVFSQLQWASGRAADVYNWAKAATKPGYNSTEIIYGSNSNVGLALDDRYTKKEIDDKIEELQGSLEADTNTTYRFDISQNKILIYKKEIAGQEALLGTFEVDFEGIRDEIEGVASSVSNLEKRTETAEGEISVLKGKVGNLTGAFTFQGSLESYEDLPTAAAENKGYVYLIGNVEYVSDGTQWILLGDEGSYVLKSTYNTYLQTQQGTDNEQNRRIQVLEGDRHAHTNKDVLDGITSTKISNWDNAEANAKSYADGIVKTQTDRIDTIVNTTIPNLTDRVEDIENNYVKYADVLILDCGGVN